MGCQGSCSRDKHCHIPKDADFIIELAVLLSFGVFFHSCRKVRKVLQGNSGARWPPYWIMKRTARFVFCCYGRHSTFVPAQDFLKCPSCRFMKHTVKRGLSAMNGNSCACLVATV